MEVAKDEEPEIILHSNNKHWKMLKNVFTASRLFTHLDVNPEEDVDKLVRDVIKIPTNKLYRKKKEFEQRRSPMVEALQEDRRDQVFFNIIEKGVSEDFSILDELLESDRTKLLKNHLDPKALINKKNQHGFTPLHIACRNGNIEYTIFLLGKGANWTIVSDEEKESCLEVAARWGYRDIVNVLLTKPWSSKVLKLASKVTKSPEIKSQLKNTKKKKYCGCWF